MSAEPLRLEITECRGHLRRFLEESAPGEVLLLSSPRQTGKTALLRELTAEAAGAVEATGSSAETRAPEFLERLGSRAAALADREGRALVVLDEVHLFPDWAGRLHALANRFRRDRKRVRVVAACPLALHTVGERIAEHVVRFRRLDLGHWTAPLLARVSGMPPAEAAEFIVRCGAYPALIPLAADREARRAYVERSVIDRVVEDDLPSLALIRRPLSLRCVLRTATASPARIVNIQDLQAELTECGAQETIAHYLHLLEGASLVAAVPRYAVRATARRTAPLKLIVLNHALLADGDTPGAGDPGEPLGSPDLRPLVENACLAHAWNAGQRVTYWRGGGGSVDGVLEGSWGSWAVSVCTGPSRTKVAEELRAFVRKFPTFRPLLLVDDAEAAPGGTGVVTRGWRSFLRDGVGVVDI